ncbi:lipopolysaccharide-induced tumor necrosis factor-alpha factor homolog [Mizuhopecten yessoensis]|uniref:Lipopolysaccharide-induced tumor necrosis factor-alpha factor-like n=1 Tax=Mizuhopecten yessoensis TaxID=6573 RepID=A0A210QGT7_MIZYE|nr:lipopolysaccharide-induced tumor necrosis factor-alpha factor homolog [Mizuhopecten yessoensis]OWF47962.1 Lipopolysaccharide-induced tumor necrosis factor-alpha factor-like [Mizuhopecten yessoensis]
MSEKTGPQTYQTIPQPGEAAPSYPSEPPPKYEAGPQSGYQQAPQPQGYPPQGSYPQAPGYNAQGQPVYMAQTTLVVQPQIGFGPNPTPMQCQHCHANISTALEYEAGALTWLSAGVLCIFGCWLGCCLIPFCINDLSDVQHKCPNCNKLVGVYRKLS